MSTQIIQATWMLVISTFLLTAATTVPFIGDILQRRKERVVLIARVVPDLWKLRTRLFSTVWFLDHPERLIESDVARQIGRVEEDLKSLALIIEVRDASLLFTNELFILRHFLTTCRDEFDVALYLSNSLSTDDIRKRNQYLQSARCNYQAALLTLDAAKVLLSRRQARIKGERFWDRFERVSKQRSTEAAHQLLERNR